MNAKASQPGFKGKKVKVRFLRQVKTGGRWYEAGEVSLLTLDVSQELERAGLVEKLESESQTRSATGKGGSRAVSND